MCFEILKLYFIVTLLYTEVNPEIQTESTKTLHQEVKTMKKLWAIAIISIVLIVAFTYLWATMTGAVSNVFAGAMVASAVAFIVSLNKCVHFA